jgi:hypothetical protein
MVTQARHSRPAASVQAGKLTVQPPSGRGIQHVGHGVLLCSSVAPMVVRDRAGRL